MMPESSIVARDMNGTQPQTETGTEEEEQNKAICISSVKDLLPCTNTTNHPPPNAGCMPSLENRFSILVMYSFSFSQISQDDATVLVIRKGANIDDLGNPPRQLGAGKEPNKICSAQLFSAMVAQSNQLIEPRSASCIAYSLHCATTSR
jgi:hypothetical protein